MFTRLILQDEISYTLQNWELRGFSVDHVEFIMGKISNIPSYYG